VPARIADAQRRGVACFDRHFYVNANQFDLGFIEAQPDPQVMACCARAAAVVFIGCAVLRRVVAELRLAAIATRLARSMLGFQVDQVESCDAQFRRGFGALYQMSSVALV
jgi:hypothetical protein